MSAASKGGRSAALTVGAGGVVFDMAHHDHGPMRSRQRGCLPPCGPIGEGAAREALLNLLLSNDDGFDAPGLQVLAGQLQDLPSAEELKDAKTRLQELLQARGIGLPEYVVDKEHGKAHERTFEVSCRVATLDQVTHGRARSRRGAEQAAAERMLEAVGDDPQP